MMASQEVASDLQWRLELKDLPIVRRLGRGLSGYLNETRWGGKKCARKDFPLGLEKRNGSFETEVKVLFTLYHRNIVQCFGYTVGQSSCSLLQEYVDDNLQNTVQRRIDEQRKRNSTSTSQPRVLDVDEIKRLLSITVKKKESVKVKEGSSRTTGSRSSIIPFEVHEAEDIVFQIATGMKYLHDNDVVHGDLKPRNVLLNLETGERKIKVADLGLTETKRRIKLASKRTRHFEILTWKAPELLEELLGPLTKNSDDPFTDSDTDSDEAKIRSSDIFVKSKLAMADVYSFGLTCSYVLGGKLMYPDLRLTQLREQRMQGCKPELPSACPKYLQVMIHSCLEFEPSSRPTFSYICTMKEPVFPHIPQLQIEMMKDPGSWELVVEPIAQVSQALEVIENVCKISSTVWVNKNQCERIANRFNVIAEGLKGMGLDKNFVGGKALNNVGSSKDYPGFDELLIVLRKGEALVSYYRVWKGIISAVSRTDNREAFQEIHQELDTLDSQFHFEGSDGKDMGLASGVERSAMLMEDAEKDLKEMPKKLEELVRIGEDPTQANQEKPDVELETLKQVVSEKSKPVAGDGSKPVGEDGKLPIYLSIDLTTVETKAPVRELVRQNKQDPTDKDGWALVHNGRWLGCEFAVKVFKSGDQSEWNNEQLLKEVGALVELRHPHVIRLVAFGQDSERSVFLMEKMDADLRNFMKKKLEPAPRPKPRPFTRSEELDIITQIAKGMYYLHTQQYVHGDLKCTNILVKKSGDYLEVKIAELRNAMKLGGVWDQAAFDIACSTRRPRWTAPEAIKHFGGVRPSRDSLLKSDVYSFAMTCYEVVTGKYPFDGITDDALLEQIEAGVRPELPGELDGDLNGVITSCWDPDPNNRPNFGSICYILDYIRSKQSAIGTTNSSGKDVVLSRFKRSPQVHGALSGLLDGVRDREQNANIPAGESSSWEDHNKGQELQQSDSTNLFAEHLRIEPNDLKKQRRIGRGTSATVYAATWLGCTFAVKRFKSQLDIRELRMELEFLIPLRHPYIAQLVGLSVSAEQECMIVREFMNSNLRELIESRQRKRKLISRTQNTSPQLADVLPFDLYEAVIIIWKIALGMAFLHSRGIMHRDLKSPNVLVQEHPGHIDVKIVDFGLSSYVSKSPSVGMGTGFWRAPEILPTETNRGRSSKPNLRAIDVYAFAMTSYEVLTGGIPCSELQRSDYDPVIKGHRPKLPSDLHPDLKVLIENSWHSEPEKRPDFIYICEELRRIQQALSNLTS